MFERARLGLALWYTAVFAVLLVALGAVAYGVMARELDQEIDESLTTAVDEVSRLPATELFGEFGPRGRGHGEPPPAHELSSDIFFFLIGEDGAVVNDARNIDADRFPLAALQRAPEEGHLSDDIRVDGTHYRVTAAPATSTSGQEFTLVVGRSLESRDYQLRLLAIVFGVGGIAGLALAAGAGFLLAGRALVPIRQSLDTQRRFVSDASHELRTPVAVMKANAELLLRHPDQTVEANIDQVAAINEEADHLTRLVGDLLMLARADEHGLDVVRERIDVNEVLGGLLRDLGPVADARGLALESDVAPATINADAQRLRQLVVILVDNALKFTPAGGTIRVHSSIHGSRWMLSVADTGRGIPLEDQPHIFDRFYRVDESRTPQGGTGLGLAIARWIVEAHHGRITVSSLPGQGATFTVNLPAR